MSAPQWKLMRSGADHFLSPVAVSPEHATLASSVPGCYADERSIVTGQLHALSALLELSGQPGRWLFPLSEPGGDGTLPPYQALGVQFMHRNLPSGVLNNDDVGLGKTVQTISTLLSQDPTYAKIILCPAFLRSQWEKEITRWTEKFTGSAQTVHVVLPAGKRKKTAPPPPTRPDWIVAFYLDAAEAMEFLAARPYYLVMDEIHNVRGYKTRRMDSVRAASNFASGRIGLTASLMYNDPARLHPILDLVSPGAWGSFYSFAVRYGGAQDGMFGLQFTGKLANVSELKKRLGLVSIRRTREDVAKELPFDTKFQTLWLESGKTGSGMLATGLADLAHHARLIAHAKTEAIAEQAKDDTESGLPTVTFTWLRDHATELSQRIAGSLLILGGGDSSTRLDKISDYVASCRATGKVPHVIGTYDALGEGANLQWAKAVNLGSLDFTPDKLKQAIGRAARMGQSGTVLVRIWCVRNSVDEHYLSVVKSKLTEQFKLDGRQEQDKKSLFDALSPVVVKDALQAMLERALAAEAGNKT